MSQPAPIRPEDPSVTLGPQGALPSVEECVLRSFGDFAALAVMQGTKIELARVFVEQVFGMDWRSPAVQGPGLELAAARREEAMLEHAVERAVAGRLRKGEVVRGQDHQMAYTLAFAETIKAGDLDMFRNRLKEVRGQASRAENALWALKRVVTARQTPPRPQPQPAQAPRRFVAGAQPYGADQSLRAPSSTHPNPSHAAAPARLQGSSPTA
jgi:hypothetical protein